MNVLYKRRKSSKINKLNIPYHKKLKRALTVEHTSRHTMINNVHFSGVVSLM